MGSIEQEDDHYEVLIIGAGLSGICSLHHIRERFPSWRIKVLEAGEGPGGTWFFNRYPGARFDSESVSYGFSFDLEILNNWHWKEAFSPQPETLRYIDYVCEKHELLKDMQFNTRIATAQWDDSKHAWILRDDAGRTYQTRFLVSCIGFLSKPENPKIIGIDDFAGQRFHTSQWPKDCVPSRDFAGKRIGIIGTGATGIQTITALSNEPELGSLHVFQRTANWSAPLRNFEISEEQMQQYRKEYGSIFQRCASTPSCLLHEADPRKASELTQEERLELWEKLYAEPGFGKWLGTFKDTYTDRVTNKLYSDFMAQKIRERLDDPVVAESLVPKDHGFGTRRVPLESGYFEAYNKPNVHLIDLRKTPIDRFTPNGILTEDGTEHQLDSIIFATGFDPITGAFNAIKWQGKDGVPLLGPSEPGEGENAVWVDNRPRTYLGLTVPAMPNLFMILGPHQLYGNATRSIEHAVDVVCGMLQHCQDRKITYMEPTLEAADAWTEHVFECSKGFLMNEVDSWMTGVNKNVKGKTVRSVARYMGSAIEYRRRCEECRTNGWEGFILK